MKNIFVLLIVITGLVSCKKTFLDQKPDDSDVVPTTLYDLQALLDNDRMMNGATSPSYSGPTPALLIVGVDDYFVPDNFINGQFPTSAKNIYVWARENVYDIHNIDDWDAPYRCVFYSNIVLEQLPNIPVTATNQEAWNNLKGSGLFYRSFAFFQLAQAFAPFYDPATAATDLGIPLPTDPDINQTLSRATLKETYDRVINDLIEAKELLPLIPQYKTRPSKPAVYAMLARIAMSMRDYPLALKYADSCLALHNALLDYKTLPTTPVTAFPFVRFNAETIFHTTASGYPTDFMYSPSFARVDTTFYNSYVTNDARKLLFFRSRETNRYSYRNSYENTSKPFTGLATDEVLLIKAEAQARAGDAQEAMNTLNTLMIKRWRTNFVPFTAADAPAALALVLTERRKQLVNRGVRWTDLRRLNKEGANITLRRIHNGETFTLPPNDLRYTWPIPDYVLAFNPGMQQNPR